jgi:hypothetical protein
MNTRRTFLGTVLGLAIGCSATGDGSGTSPPAGPGGSNGAGGTGAAAGTGGKGGSSGSGGSSLTGGTGANGGAGGSILLDAGGGLGSGGAAGSGGAPTDAAGGAAGGAADPCVPPNDQPVKEICGNGIDENLNGFVDEGCVCTFGASQPCFGGPPSKQNAPECHKGTQTCAGSGEFPGWSKCDGWACGTVTLTEICDNQLDDDCDGQIDEGCELDVPVNIDGDCIYASCPPQAPYPVGCTIIMDGGDSRGCVAVAPGSSLVYFQEGNNCPFLGIGGAGHVGGSLLCSTVQKGPLDATNCPITTKTQSFYPTDPNGCPK